ncbi:cyclase family protein [Streptomyces sp. NPDC002402]
MPSGRGSRSSPASTTSSRFALRPRPGRRFHRHRYTLVGQWGTIATRPRTSFAGARTLDRIPVEEMVLPLVVLDIAARVERDPDSTPTLDDVASWEQCNGPVPSGSFVALRTGWSRRRPDPMAMANRDDAGAATHRAGRPRSCGICSRRRESPPSATSSPTPTRGSPHPPTTTASRRTSCDATAGRSNP